jgi:hypothetical protein
MKNQNAAPSPLALDAMQSRFARRIAGLLDEGAKELPHDFGERLKFAREQALARAQAGRKSVAVAPDFALAGAGTATWGSRGGSGSWWMKLGALVPLAALVVGLVVIQRSQLSSQISAAAEIDAALLSDDVPPAAYSDPGFVEFLKVPPSNN